MSGDDHPLLELMRDIVTDDVASVSRSLVASPALASRSLAEHDRFFEPIRHYVYLGDTPLHVAAAAHRPNMVSALVSLGADVRARNRRGAEPLHYAADGVPGSPRWDPERQRDTIVALLAAGADPNAPDKGGVTPLHRAVRNRCAGAVRALLEGGADVRRPNGSGSTPVQLAHWTTGRGGSGSAAAKIEQHEIIRLFADLGVV